MMITLLKFYQIPSLLRAHDLRSFLCFSELIERLFCFCSVATFQFSHVLLDRRTVMQHCLAVWTFDVCNLVQDRVLLLDLVFVYYFVSVCFLLHLVSGWDQLVQWKLLWLCCELFDLSNYTVYNLYWLRWVLKSFCLHKSNQVLPLLALEFVFVIEILV